MPRPTALRRSGAGREDEAEGQVPDERPRFVRLRAGSGEQQRDGGDRCQRADDERQRLRALRTLRARPRDPDDREEASGERTRERAQHRATDGKGRLAVLERVDRTEGEGNAERVGGPPDDEIDDRAEREPEASEPCHRSECETKNAFEDERRRDAAERAERERTDRRADCRRDHAVAEQRVATEPLTVPEHEPVLAEQLGAKHLRGEIRPAPAERDREDREHSRDGDDRGHGGPPLEAGRGARARRDRECAAHHGPAARRTTRDWPSTALRTRGGR